MPRELATSQRTVGISETEGVGSSAIAIEKSPFHHRLLGHRLAQVRNVRIECRLDSKWASLNGPYEGLPVEVAVIGTSIRATTR
jgi:hypothetical protein